MAQKQICRKCGKSGEFYLWSPYWCKACHSKYGKAYRQRPEVKARLQRRDQNRNGHWLERRYGITQKEYDDLFKSQGGLCLICRGTGGKTKLAVDHDHSTGKVRALLCTRCNMALGLLKDNPRLARRAANYLIKFSQIKAD